METMTEKTLTKTQAKQFAYAFLSAVPSYIERNKDKYIQWLQATGNTDPYYKPDKEITDK